MQKRILHSLPGFIVFNVTSRAGAFRKSLKLRRDSGIEGPEFHWSASVKMLNRAGMPLLNPDMKAREVVLLLEARECYG